MMMMQRHLNDPPDMKKVTAERVRPVVEGFFKGLQPEQWRALKSARETGNPDFATENMLEEFIIELIGIMSEHILSRVQGGSVAVSEANVFFELSNALPQTSALDIDVDLARMTLAKLIAKEVMLNVQSELSSSSSSSSTSEGLCIRAVPPKRLSHMIILGFRMIKGYICNMDCLCGCRLQSQESDQSVVERTEEQDKKLEEIHVDEDYKKDVIASQGSLNTATLKTVQHVIEKAATEPAMSILAQGGQKCVPPSDTFEEKLAVEPADSTEEAIQHDKDFQPLAQEGENKVKKFFAKHFAKLTILCSAAKLRAKFWGKTRTDSSESVEKPVESVDALLQTEETQSGRDVSDLETGSILLQSIQLEDSAPTEPKKKHGAIVGFLSMLGNAITKPLRGPKFSREFVFRTSYGVNNLK